MNRAYGIYTAEVCIVPYNILHDAYIVSCFSHNSHHEIYKGVNVVCLRECVRAMKIDKK